MKEHVAGPLIAILSIIIIILVARPLIVPKDFGAHERGYMLGWHRKGNENDWKHIKIKYQGSEYCKDCHGKNYTNIMNSPHKNINCENCHGPAIDHPTDPLKLSIDRSRALCLRCHARLAYPTSGRRLIRGFDETEKQNSGHYTGMECTTCHDPHRPKLS